MTSRIEVRDQRGHSLSVLDLQSGDTFSHPLTPQKWFSEELLVVFPAGNFNHTRRFSFGPLKGQWQGIYNQLEKGEEQSFAVPFQSRLTIKNI